MLNSSSITSLIRNIIFLYFLLITYNGVMAKDILVTIKPIYSLISILDPDNTNLLVKNDISPHEIDLTYSQIDLINNSSIIFAVSKNLESSVARHMENNYKNKKIIFLDDLLIDSLSHSNGSIFDNDDFKSSSKGHSHSGDYIDYHFWTDISKVKIMLEKVARILIQENPKNKSQYENNLYKAIQRLNNLDKTLKNKIKNTNIDKFLIYHDGWDYFIKSYKLPSLGNINSSSGGHNHHLDSSMSIKKIKFLSDFINKNNIKCIFTENEFNDAVLSNFIKKENIKSFEIDSIGYGMENNDSLYFNMMLQNINKIIQCS